MKSNLKKWLAAMLVAIMAITVLTACGGSGGTANTTGDTPNAQTDGADDNKEPEGGSDEVDPNKPYAGTVIKYAVTATAAEGAEVQELVKLIEERTGIIVEFTIIPTAVDGEVDKTLVSLQAGDPIDIIAGSTSKLNTFYNAGVLAPLDELAANVGYDMESVFGAVNLPIFDGNTYGLPASSDIWITYINTKWFKEAGIDIPEADGWTWEKYIETAQKIQDANLVTDSGAPVWGSFMEAYDCYNYMYATQKGAQPYKEDGTANFDDPLYTEAVEWFYSLGNDLKIQPDMINMMAGTYPWNQFVAADDMAMFVCGGWVASMLPNTEQYPRDWECKILPLPYPEGEDPSTLVIQSCYAIPSTSQNKEAAFEALKVIAEEQYTLGYGRIPARANLSEEEIMDYVENILLPTTFKVDDVTAEDVRKAWFDSERTLLPEKIIGTAEGTISQIWIEEAQLYGTGAKSLEDAMKNIQERSNNAIAEELNVQ